ncbi:MAG: calcium/sodium antiporter [Clostridia bacterium]|nr:calcium/sodium antiporter [Clostridia bacterium]
MWWDVVLAILLLIAGFGALIKGADWFVDGAAGIAAKLRIPTLVIGLTIVAFGTSAPELATSLISASEQSVGIAIGNILGSNICNILLILGLSASIAILPIHKDSLKVDLPALLIASGLLIVFGVTGNEINRIEGGIMALLLVAYTAYLVVNALKNRDKEAIADLENHEVVVEEEQKGFGAWYEKMKGYTWFLGIILVFGLAVVVGGAMMAVEGAKTIAGMLGVSENIIGLTVVAIGTSLPELITSVMAAKKGETDIAVGNIIGSNLFNILMVGGLSAVIFPLPFAPDGNSFLSDGIIALGSAVLLAVFAYLPGHKLKKWQGIVMLAGAVAYYTFTVLRAVAIL